MTVCDNVSVLFKDVTMPKVNGLMLMEIAKERRPENRDLVASGRTAPPKSGAVAFSRIGNPETRLGRRCTPQG